MNSTDNQPSRKQREILVERMRAKYPDSDFENEDNLYEQINADYDDYDNRISQYKDDEQKLLDMFSSDPRSASFLANWSNGEDPTIQLVRIFGDEIKEALEDPQKLDALAEANKEYVERVAEEKRLEEEYKSNLANSLSLLSDIQAKYGMSDDEVDNTMQFLVGIYKDGVMGIFSEQTIEMAIKALNYDKDVTEAEHIGEVRGRNTKIEERLRRRSEGDGTAMLGGKNGSAPQVRNKQRTVFDIASEA